MNDGSPDESPAICRRYAKKDKRITVIDQKNKGLPGARATGVAAASGSKVMFVDGDDMIDKMIVEKLADTMQSSKSQITVCTYSRFTNEIPQDSSITTKYKPLIYSTPEALCQLMYQKNIIPSQWGKLYNKDLFNGLDFPNHNYDEDFAMTYRLIAKAETVAVLSGYAGYLYRYDPSSISNEGSGLAEKVKIGMSIAVSQLAFAKKLAVKNPEYNKVVTAAEYRCFAEAVFLAIKIPSGHNGAEWKKLSRVINKYKLKVLADSQAPSIGRKRALIACLAGAGTLQQMLRRKVTKRLQSLASS